MRPKLCIDARHCTSGIKKGNENIVKFRGSNGQLLWLGHAEEFFKWYADPSAMSEAQALLESCNESQSFVDMAKEWKKVTKIAHPQIALFSSINELQLANAPTIVHHLQCAKKEQYGLEYSHGKLKLLLSLAS